MTASSGATILAENPATRRLSALYRRGAAGGGVERLRTASPSTFIRLYSDDLPHQGSDGPGASVPGAERRHGVGPSRTG
jgi:hypothetical protein